MSCKLLGGMTIGYEYKTDTDPNNKFIDMMTEGLSLIGKISHEMFNIPQLLPLNVKIDIKQQLAIPNFIL